jgi:hypothetical protein
MKIIISERQLGIISEQWYNDPKHPEYKQFAPTDYEKRELKKVDNQIVAQDKLGKVIKKLGPNLDVDDYTDIVSGLLDVIPGIGNLASAGIDVTHGVTYIVRFFYAKTFEEKVEMAVMAIITLGMAVIPVGGNAANMVARGEIKMLLKMTPHEVLVVMKKMGLIKSAGFKLSKTMWKYSLLIALVKICRGQLDNVIGDVSRTIASISDKSKDLKPILVNFSKEIKDVLDVIDKPENKSLQKPNIV